MMSGREREVYQYVTWWRWLVLLTSLPLCSLAAPDVTSLLPAVTSLLRARAHSHALLYTCGGAYERVRMSSALISAGVSVLAVDVTHTRTRTRDAERRLFEEQRTAAIVHLDCKYALDHIQKVGDFGDTVQWVVVAATHETAASAAPRLRRLPLTLSSEVLLLMPTDGTWYAFDVHTVDHKKATPLNMIFYGVHWSTSAAQQAGGAAQQAGGMPRYPAQLVLQQNVSYSAGAVAARLASVLRNVRHVQVAPGGWRVLLTDNRVERRRDWHGVELSAATVLYQIPRGVSARRFVSSERATHLDSTQRYALLLIRYMQDMYRFRTRVVRVPLFGEVRNGSWVGAAGALRAGAADLAGTPLLVQAGRLPAVQFAAPVVTQAFPTLFLQPAAAPTASPREFAAPLAAAAWAAALLLALACVAASALASRHEMMYLGNSDNDQFSFGECLMSFVNVFYMNGCAGAAPRLWAGRCAALAGAVLGVLVVQFYSAALLASVLARPPRRLASLADLLRAGDMHYRAEDQPYLKQFFKESRDVPEIAQLYDKKLMSGASAGGLPPFIDIETGVKKVREGNFAFQCGATVSYAYREMARWRDEELCQVDQLLVFPLQQQYFVVAPRSPYRDHAARLVLLVRERGVAARMMPRYYRPRPRCPPEHAAAPRPVSGAQFYPAIYMLAALGGVSVCVLLAELAAARLRARTRLPTTTTPDTRTSSL